MVGCSQVSQPLLLVSSRLEDLRGGVWLCYTIFTICADRDHDVNRFSVQVCHGFDCVLSQTQVPLCVRCQCEPTKGVRPAACVDGIVASRVPAFRWAGVSMCVIQIMQCCMCPLVPSICAVGLGHTDNASSIAAHPYSICQPTIIGHK